MSAAELKPPVEVPRHRWQFSLRALLIAITVLCVVLATFGADWWFLVFIGCELAILLAVLGLEANLTFHASVPSRRDLWRGAAICACGALALTLMAILHHEIGFLRGELFWRAFWLLSGYAASFPA